MLIDTLSMNRNWQLVINMLDLKVHVWAIILVICIFAGIIVCYFYVFLCHIDAGSGSKIRKVAEDAVT